MKTRYKTPDGGESRLIDRAGFVRLVQSSRRLASASENVDDEPVIPGEEDLPHGH